jgi:hypothetical protein
MVCWLRKLPTAYETATDSNAKLKKGAGKESNKNLYVANRCEHDDLPPPVYSLPIPSFPPLYPLFIYKAFLNSSKLAH